MNDRTSLYCPLPLRAPLRLHADEDIAFELTADGNIHAVDCIGKIAGSGGAEKDIVISFRFEDQHGDPLTDVCRGLLRSDVVGDFIYPLQRSADGEFQTKFWLDAPVHKIVATIRLWRRGTDAAYTIKSFSLRPKHHDPRFAPQPDFQPGESSLAWIFDRISLNSGTPKEMLDIAFHGDCSAATVEQFAGADLKVDRVQLGPLTVESSSLAVERATGLSSSRRYDVITLCDDALNWSSLVEEFVRLEAWLKDDGLLIAAMASHVLDEPDSLRKRLEKIYPAKAVSRDRVNDLLSVVAAFVHRPLLFRAIAMVPAISIHQENSEKHWVVLEKAEGVANLRDVVGLSDALESKDWAAVAQLLLPDARSLDSDKAIPCLKPLSGVFALAAKEASESGDLVAAVNCRFVKAMFNPRSEQSLCELIAQIRVAEDFDLADEVIRIAQERFPGSWAVRLHQAMVYVLSGREMEAMHILDEYIGAMANFNPSMRRGVAFLLRNFARVCQSAGIKSDAIHPLLLPDIMEAYTRDLETNTQTWHTSAVTKVFNADAEERRQLRMDARSAVEADTEKRPLKMLMLTSGSWKFLLNMFSYIEDRPDDFELRTYDMGFLDERNASTEHLHEHFAPVSLGLDPEDVWTRAIEEDATLQQLVEWSDMVFCEWSGRHAIWLSRYLPPEKRLILRLHSYEAFTPWPFFINYGGVDGIVFVAEHIRRFSDRQFRMSDHGVPMTVLPNFNNLSGFARPKTTDARRNLAMVGYSNLNKDPILALEILERLRRDDPDWRLHLFGEHWAEDALGKHESAYYQKFKDYVRQEKLEKLIVYRGYTKDIPSALENIGYVLSCSRREGTHEAVLEGMATGAVPVIRRWPMVKALGAPETTYPDLTYFDTVDEAVEQIRAVSSAEAFKVQSARSVDYALSRFDQDAVYPKFRDFVQDVMQGRADR